MRVPGPRRWQATEVVVCFPPLPTSCLTSHCRGSLVCALRMFTPFFTLALWMEGVRKGHSVRLKLSEVLGLIQLLPSKCTGWWPYWDHTWKWKQSPLPRLVSHRTCWNILGYSLNHTRKSYMIPARISTKKVEKSFSGSKFMCG